MCNFIIILFTALALATKLHTGILPLENITASPNEALIISLTSKQTNSKINTNNSTFILLNLIILANDIEQNPGPPPKYPCGVCQKAVRWNQKALCCDSCNIWYHTKCENIHDTIYATMHNSNTSWECLHCGMPNFSTTLFDLHDIQNEKNPYESLEFLDGTNTVPPASPPPHLGSPIHSSSPLKDQPHTKANYKHKQKNPQKPLRIINLNCQSIKNKKAEFLALVESCKPDVIFGTESWLNKNVFDAEYFPENYSVFRKDRPESKKGGGVFIAVTTDLIASVETDLDTDCEIIWAKINIAGCKQLNVCAYYRPDVNDETSLDNFEMSLSRLKNLTQHTIIAGDFNFPGWDWENETLKDNCQNPQLHKRFGDILNNHGLTQLIKSPTRGPNILDLILTNNPDAINRTEVIPGISDHDCCFAEINVNPLKLKQTPRKINLYNKADWVSFKTHLLHTHKTIVDLYETSPVEDLWSLLKEAITSGTEKFIPSKLSKPKDGHPWITLEIKKLMHKRDKLFKNHRSSEKYKDLKRHIQQKLRNAYWKYIDNIVTPENSDNPDKPHNCSKKFWTFIKHSKSNNSGISPLKENGTLFSDPKKKAEILNNQFQSVFSKDTNPNDTQTQPDKLFPDMPDIQITEPGVLKLLLNLKPHKAQGPDNISPKILKELAVEISPSLTLIFKKSYDTGVVPNDWKAANVSPVFKKGEKYKASNYRPISLTCIASKLMEHIVTSNIMSHSNSNNILYPLQHGFRSKLSCETQLIEFVNDIATNMQKGAQTDVIVMDFSKAFAQN